MCIFPILVTFFGFCVHSPQATGSLRPKYEFKSDDFPLEIFPIKI